MRFKLKKASDHFSGPCMTAGFFLILPHIVAKLACNDYQAKSGSVRQQNGEKTWKNQATMLQMRAARGACQFRQFLPNTSDGWQGRRRDARHWPTITYNSGAQVPARLLYTRK